MKPGSAEQLVARLYARLCGGSDLEWQYVDMFTRDEVSKGFDGI
jgi:hypothetical protein